MMRQDEIEILLVEDDPDDLELTMRALSQEPACDRVHVTCDGQEALDFLFCRGPYSQRDPDCQLKLILLDLKLPKVNGLEVLEQIKRDPRTRLVPVVILTSSRQEQDVMRRGYRLGVNCYVQKPVDFKQFRETIQRLGYYWLVVNQPPFPAAFEGATPDETLSRA